MLTLFKSIINKIYKSKPKTIILLYHRVANLEIDPQLLSVSIKNFDCHINYLKNNFNIIKLDDIINYAECNNNRANLAITFDDGYADNFWNAVPILEKYNVPATFFITTGLIGKNKEFWWDKLERITLLQGNLPEQLSIYINNKKYDWDLSRGVINNNLTNKAHLKWNVTLSEIPTAYHGLYKDLHSLLRPLKDGDRDILLNYLATWAGLSDEYRENYRILNQDEILSLSKNHLIDIGAHTITHPILSNMILYEQRNEIIDSKAYLEKLTGIPIKNFSYPYGSFSDINNDTIQSVKEAKYQLACANYGGHVTKIIDPYMLPRNIIRNWDKNEFINHLNTWLYD